MLRAPHVPPLPCAKTVRISFSRAHIALVIRGSLRWVAAWLEIQAHPLALKHLQPQINAALMRRHKLQPELVEEESDFD